MVALLAGKGLALAAGKPLIAVNHLEGHALSAAPRRSGPRLSLSAAAGLRRALPAAGGARSWRLPPPRDHDRRCGGRGVRQGGQAARSCLSRRTGDRGAGEVAATPHAVPLPRPLVGSGEPHFSFAGLKSAVQRAVASGDFRPEDIAASFQQAVVDCLDDRTRLALRAKRRTDPGCRGRRRRQPGDPQRACRACEGGRAPLQRPAGMALHRQCGDDRLGRRGASRQENATH